MPIIPKTLFIRLLGKGKTQQQAINEILAFPEDDNVLRFQNYSDVASGINFEKRKQFLALFDLVINGQVEKVFIN